jgi:hypothetical protein
MSPSPCARARTALLALALVAAVAGCTADDESEPGPSPQTSASSAPTLMVEPGPLRVRLAPVRGQLAEQARDDVRATMRRVLGAWMEGGFGAQDGPDHPQAYARYTPRAGDLARRQRAVTTNAALGPELVEVVPTRRVAEVSVLAAGGRAVGASADVLLVLVGAREDGSQTELVVRGRLRLTPTSDGWKVFGFDLTRSVGAPGTHARSVRGQRAGGGR